MYGSRRVVVTWYYFTLLDAYFKQTPNSLLVYYNHTIIMHTLLPIPHVSQRTISLGLSESSFLHLMQMMSVVVSSTTFLQRSNIERLNSTHTIVQNTKISGATEADNQFCNIPGCAYYFHHVTNYNYTSKKPYIYRINYSTLPKISCTNYY